MGARKTSTNDAIQALRLRIGDAALSYTFSRSGGPGGQNINKVSTRATVWFDLDGTEALTHREKRRIRDKLGGRINRSGRVHVTSMRHRTQAANRRAATERLFDLLADALQVPTARRPTSPTAAARERRLREKRARGMRKQMRSGGSGDDG